MYLQTNLYLQTGGTGFDGSAGDRVDTNLIIFYMLCHGVAEFSYYFVK